MIGISKDSTASHRKFIAKHKLNDLPLLSDQEMRVIRAYDAKHWLLPVASRIYIIIDKDRRILFRENTGFSLLENQTETLVRNIDELIR